MHDSSTFYAEKKSGGMYIIQQRNYLPQFYYLHTKWTSHYKSFTFTYDHSLHTALQQLAWFQYTITITVEKIIFTNNRYSCKDMQTKEISSPSNVQS